MKKLITLAHSLLARLALVLTNYSQSFIKDNISKDEISVKKINNSTFHLMVTYKIIGVELPLLFRWDAVNDRIRTFKTFEEANKFANQLIDRKAIENVMLELA